MSESKSETLEEKPARDLPAVQPPSTTFFIQLFILPALIVAGVMVVYFAFGKVTKRNSIDELLEIVQSDRGDRWRAAHDVSHLLREESRHARDPRLAYRFAMALEQALHETTNRDEKFIEYLCGAVGSFHIPAGTPMLREAAKPDWPKTIRRSSLIALARLAERLEGKIDDPNVLLEVREYVSDDDSDIRELACFVLGFLGDVRAVPNLTAAVDDPIQTVSFNAAAALGTLGSDAGLPVFRQMLDYDALTKQLLVREGLREGEPDESLIAATLLAAIRSLEKLHDKAPATDFSDVTDELGRLAEQPNSRVKVEAKSLLLRLNAKSSDS